MKTLYNLSFDHGFFLAPLSGYTNWPMRMLSRQFGAELCYTEMISAAGMIRRTRNTKNLLERPQNDRPLVVQIFAESVDEASLAARMLEDQGFDGIDINMGCPVKKVVSKGAGVALMKDAHRAVCMAQAVKNAVSMPVSVKMRAGWDTSSMNAAELACMLEKTGISLLILHPRTRADMYRGSPHWEVFAQVKDRVSLPVVASGDIREPEDIKLARSLGADAFMVGRGAIGRPWIFRELAGGQAVTPDERREIMLHHLDMLCTCFGEGKGTRHMRKFLSAYVKGLRGAVRFRQNACMAENAQQLQSTINKFFKCENMC